MLITHYLSWIRSCSQSFASLNSCNPHKNSLRLMLLWSHLLCRGESGHLERSGHLPRITQHWDFGHRRRGSRVCSSPALVNTQAARWAELSHGGWDAVGTSRTFVYSFPDPLHQTFWLRANVQNKGPGPLEFRCLRSSHPLLLLPKPSPGSLECRFGFLGTLSLSLPAIFSLPLFS